MKSTWSAVLAACVAGAMAVGVAAAATFEGLGFLPGGTYSEAMGVSAGGSFIVGVSGTTSGTALEEPQGFLWTAAGGMTPVPRPEGLIKAWASGVSADGGTICGWASNSVTNPLGTEGFRWNVASGAMDRIAVDGADVWVKGMSADGSILVGGAGPPATTEAFTWTAAGGMNWLGGLFDPPFRSDAKAISADGLVVVGDSIDVANSICDAFRWEGGVMEGLGAFTAWATSRDGSVVVGWIDGGQGLFQAYRWTAATGVVPLETYGENNHSRAMGVSGNGNFIVGYVEDDSNDARDVFIWDAANGMRSLKGVLEDDLGLDLTGWQLTKATGVVSDDGATIIGRGINPSGQEEAWRAFVPELTPVPGDGVIDWLDYVAMKRNFGMGSGATAFEGDLDGDGDVDYSDYVLLGAHFGGAVPPGAAGVPEPATCLLLGLGACVPLLRRRRRR